jgi:hypothetical protein
MAALLSESPPANWTMAKRKTGPARTSFRPIGLMARRMTVIQASFGDTMSPHNSYPQKLPFSAIVAMIFVVLLSGCATQKSWRYTSELESKVQARIDKSVAVPPFLDQRLTENKNKLAMYLLPLVPYGWQELNTPEGVSAHVNSALWIWKPNEDIAKAAAEELNKAHLFKEAFFTTRASEGDIVLEGTIKSTKYDGKLMTYGLSVYGPVLWLFLPATSFDNELILSFKLVDQKNHVTLWEREYKQSAGAISWMYSMKPDFEYADMLKKMMLQVLADIQSSAASINSRIRATDMYHGRDITGEPPGTE